MSTINRDHAKVALSVYKVASHRDDLDEVGAMAAGIVAFLALESVEALRRDAADRRARPERVRLAPRPATWHRR